MPHPPCMPPAPIPTGPPIGFMPLADMAAAAAVWFIALRLPGTPGGGIVGCGMPAYGLHRGVAIPAAAAAKGSRQTMAAAQAGLLLHAIHDAARRERRHLLRLLLRRVALRGLPLGGGELRTRITANLSR